MKIHFIAMKFALHSVVRAAARCALCLTLWLSAPCLRAAAPPPLDKDTLIDSWLKAQADLHTWASEFVQTRELKAFSRPLTATGRVWIAFPDRFRWELGTPPQTIALRDPDQLLVVYPKLKRAERYSLKDLSTGPWKDAMQLLDAGFPRNRQELESRFNITMPPVTNQTAHLKLEPKSAVARRMMRQIDLTFQMDPLTLKSTQVLFADDSSLRNDFLQPQLNPDLPKNLFDPVLDSAITVTEPLKPSKK